MPFHVRSVSVKAALGERPPESPASYGGDPDKSIIDLSEFAYRGCFDTDYFYVSKNIVDKIENLAIIEAMQHDHAAKRLAELGNTTRLSIFRYLIKAGPDGLPVGKIQKTIGIPGSTLSHHIARLVSAGLVKQVRDSRTLYCVAQYDALHELIDFLQSECCIGLCDTP